MWNVWYKLYIAQYINYIFLYNFIYNSLKNIFNFYLYFCIFLAISIECWLKVRVGHHRYDGLEKRLKRKGERGSRNSRFYYLLEDRKPFPDKSRRVMIHWQYRHVAPFLYLRPQISFRWSAFWLPTTTASIPRGSGQRSGEWWGWGRSSSPPPPARGPG